MAIEDVKSTFLLHHDTWTEELTQGANSEIFFRWLTRRERQVVELKIENNMDNKEIARLFGVGIRRIQNLVSDIRTKYRTGHTHL